MEHLLCKKGVGGKRIVCEVVVLFNGILC